MQTDPQKLTELAHKVTGRLTEERKQPSFAQNEGSMFETSTRNQKTMLHHPNADIIDLT